MDPPLYPATRSLQLPGNLTLLLALQMQRNGLLANFDLGFHSYTSWLSHQKV
jgi:hypothetical protein